MAETIADKIRAMISEEKRTGLLIAGIKIGTVVRQKLLEEVYKKNYGVSGIDGFISTFDGYKVFPGDDGEEILIITAPNPGLTGVN